MHFWASLLMTEIKKEKMPAPTPEYRFHPTRKWRFDLAYPEKKIAVEIHGGVYTHGHHVRGRGFEDDREKMNEAQLLGWKVLEYSTGQVEDGTPILDLKRALA